MKQPFNKTDNFFNCERKCQKTKQGHEYYAICTKIQASIANYQKDKTEIISKIISKTVNTLNYLKKRSRQSHFWFELNDYFSRKSQQQKIPNLSELLIGSTKRETLILIYEWIYEMDPSYWSELLLQNVGTITIKQGCRLATKETTLKTPLIITSTNIMSPKVPKFQGINLSFTISNINKEE